MKLTVRNLLTILPTVSLDAEIVFQGNVPAEEDSDEPSHTICTGYVYSAFERDGQLVIDCAITDSEGGIIPL